MIFQLKFYKIPISGFMAENPFGLVLNDTMSLAGCQINPIDVNLFLQKSLEIFDKNSADKL